MKGVWAEKRKRDTFLDEQGYDQRSLNMDMGEYLGPVVFVIRSIGRSGGFKTYNGIYEPKARVDDFYRHASNKERRRALARMPDYQPPPLYSLAPYSDEDDDVALLPKKKQKSVRKEIAQPLSNMEGEDAEPKKKAVADYTLDEFAAIVGDSAANEHSQERRDKWANEKRKLEEDLKKADLEKLTRFGSDPFNALFFLSQQRSNIEVQLEAFLPGRTGSQMLTLTPSTPQ
jgi:hypothetical protein